MEKIKREREIYLVFYTHGEGDPAVLLDYTEKFLDEKNAELRARELAAKHMDTPIYICYPTLKITGTASIEKEFIY